MSSLFHTLYVCLGFTAEEMHIPKAECTFTATFMLDFITVYKN